MVDRRTRQTLTAKGSLTVVGIGLQFACHTPPVARDCIEHADKVLIISAPSAGAWLKQLNKSTESLAHLYAAGKQRSTTYREMVECILKCVRSGANVCAVTYGHPGVFSDPAHAAVRQTRDEGFEATMLPGISAEDCLFADLGVDPGARGCQSFEATDFLIRGRRFDPSSVLILWQIGIIGELGNDTSRAKHGLRVLADVLGRHYQAGHESIVYEAAEHPFCEPSIQRVPITMLPDARVSTRSTLYVPPGPSLPIDEDMMRRLRIEIPRHE